MEPDFRHLAASGPQLKPPSGTIGKWPVLGQILAGSLLEPDFGTLLPSGSLWEASGKRRKRPETAVPLGQARGGQRTPRHKRFSKQAFPSRSRRAIKTAFWNYWETARFGPNPGREPFGAGFWQFAGFWAAIKTAFWDDWETARFGPNPGREPFGAKFWPFGGFRAAIKTAFWDDWETARFGPNPGREPFGTKFWPFGGFRAAIKTAFWDYWEMARFGPNPGREPFRARFSPFGGFWAAIKTAFWNYWETARFGPNPGRGPFGARFWHFADFWKPLGSFWEASKTPGNGRAAGSSARRPENTKAQACFKASFSQSDASSRTPFVVTWELSFAFLKLETAFLAAQDLYRACSELVSAMKDSQGGPPGKREHFPSGYRFLPLYSYSSVRAIDMPIARRQRSQLYLERKTLLSVAR